MFYYQHNIGDFDKATRHLTRIERSIYRDLIELYYDTEHQLNLDTKFLCRKILANSNEEATAVEQVLNEFFTKTPDGWYHDRCEEEIERYKSNISQRAEAGRKSAAARQQKRQRALKSRSTDDERRSNDAPTNQEPLTNNHKTDKDICDSGESLPEPEKEKPPKFTEEIKQIFEYWAKVMGKNGRAKLTKDRAKCITDRLKESYTVAHIMQAIDGCKRSEWHMGKNDKATVYDDLTLICRTGSHIEKFAMNIGAGEKTYAGPQSATAAAIQFEQQRQAMSNRIAQELAELGPDGYGSDLS